MTKPHPGTTDPARPVHRVTEEGRRVREVLSYARRGARLTDRQDRAWAQWADRFVVGSEAMAARAFDHEQVFGRRAPLVVEIGSGRGDAAAAYAAAHPEVDLLALEVWRPGAAELLHRVGEAGLEHVRVACTDAVWTFEHWLPRASVRELWTFFPDPWPKKKHHKRRLVDARFASLAHDVLEPGGVWRLATDWPDYADQISEVLAATPGLEGGRVPRWEGRSETKFERRGLAEGRPAVDVEVRRTSA